MAASTCQPGQEGARVGLLPGLRPEYMQTYEKEEKKRRAPREDLSTLTAEEKVERRKARARVYSHHARKRDEAKMQALAEDVDMMQVFRLHRGGRAGHDGRGLAGPGLLPPLRQRGLRAHPGLPGPSASSAGPSGRWCTPKITPRSSRP